MHREDFARHFLEMSNAAYTEGDRENSRRLARTMLRQVQKNKDLPNRGLYVILAKAVHAHVHERTDRAQALLKRVMKQRMAEGEANGQALVAALKSAMDRPP